MSIVKKIALASLLGAAGVVLYRFVRIVVRAVFEKPAPKARSHKHA